VSDDPHQIVAVLVAGAAALSLIGWLTPLPRLTVALTGALLAAAALLAALAAPAASPDREALVALVAAAAVLALVGGGPLTTVLFDLVDRPGTTHRESVAEAGEALRGGAWIGSLERLACYAAVVSGWPEGVAVVLAVKALGRYPELRAGDRPATAERFIIGTFASVLWALACAGVTLLLLPR
jgi:hypothetical protein